MRKVYKGIFIDRKPFEYDGFEHMIGQRGAAKRQAEWLWLTTRGLEYYIKGENGRNIMITDVTKAEKLLADIKYIFKIKKNKVVGYRTDRIYNHNSTEGKKKGKAKWVVNNEKDINAKIVELHTTQTSNERESEGRD